MTQILVGSLILSMLHALIPSHWIPLVAIGRAERWSRVEMLWVTAVTGGAHALGEVVLGVIVGLVGYRLSASYEIVTRVVAPLVLVALGVVYLIGGAFHPHHEHYPSVTGDSKRSKSAIVSSLATAMFFSPCIEIEGYFFAAGAYGLVGILAVAAIYTVLTVTGMVVFVDLARRGIQKIQSRFLDRHDRTVTGTVLILLGAVAFLVRF